MSWEAFRLTSKSPAELLTVMGPAGVDGLVRDAFMACWRSLPEVDRTMDNWRRRVEQMFQRNMKVWTAIKKPAPAAFFADLAPFDSDGHFRQAMVMTWMMLPRAGGRQFKDTFAVIRAIYQRNLDAWEADHATFTAARKRTAKKAVKKTAKKSKPPRAVKRRKR
jgi:hypothetical protein